MEQVAKTCSSAASGVTIVAVAQIVANAAVPTVMSITGVVVPGVGTLHTVGGLAAVMQAFGAASLFGPVGIGGAAIGVALYGGYLAFQ